MTSHSRVFAALRDGSLLGRLDEFEQAELRVFLPTLVRYLLVADSAASADAADSRARLREKLQGMADADAVATLARAEFDLLAARLLGAVAEGRRPASADAAAPLFDRQQPFEKFTCVLEQLLGVRAAAAVDEFEPLANEFFVDEAADMCSLALFELPLVCELTALSTALLRFRCGAAIVARVACNFPRDVGRLVLHLIDLCEQPPLASAAQSAVVDLVQLHPDILQNALLSLVQSRRLPALVLRLCARLQPAERFLSFSAPLLLASDCFVAHHLSSAAKQKKALTDDGAAELKARLFDIIDALLAPDHDRELSDTAAVAQAGGAIRLAVALRLLTGDRLVTSESDLLLRLICQASSTSEEVDVSGRLLEIRLSALLACPALLHGPNELNDGAELLVVAWFQRLRCEFERAQLRLDERFVQFLLLVGMQFQAGQWSALSSLLSTSLGFKVVAQAKQLQSLRTLFSHELLDEQQLAERAARLPITAELSNELTGNLSLHCIIQLLRSRSFAKHKVPVGDWIIAQLAASVEPVHAALPELIELYVRSCFIGSSARSGADKSVQLNPPLAEPKLTPLLALPFALGRSRAPPMLLLYYLLSYENAWEAESRRSASQSAGWPAQYSGQLWLDIPVRYLLTLLDCAASYDALRAPILKLAATQCPFLMPAVGVAPLAADKLEQRVGQLAEIVVVLRRAVDGDDSVTPPVAGKLRRRWKELEAVVPRRLYTATVSTLSRADKLGFRKTVDDAQLADNPLLVLQCDDAVQRCPLAFELLLQVLRFYLLVHRRLVDWRVATAPPAVAPKLVGAAPPAAADLERERADLARALVAAQESAAVQIILEMCLPRSAAEAEASQVGALREIRCFACSFIHHMFIDDPMLCKLVHFQGYAPQLLAVTTAGVPSMHICLDFIPELLAQAEDAQRLFAVELLSRLCEQFPVVAAFSRARLAVDLLSTLLSSGPTARALAGLSSSADALVRMARVFPPLAADVCTLLHDAASVCRARPFAPTEAALLAKIGRLVDQRLTASVLSPFS